MIANETDDGPLYLATFGIICRFKTLFDCRHRSFEIRNSIFIIDVLIDAGVYQMPCQAIQFYDI